MTTRRRTFVAGMAALAGSPLRAQTPPFPSRVIRIVPFGAAGGPIDALARVYAERCRSAGGNR